jgi:hypothetical protein
VICRHCLSHEHVSEKCPQRIDPLRDLRKLHDYSANLFEVRLDGQSVLISWGSNLITRKEAALNLAAWIVALVDPGQERFGALLEEIRK